MGTLSPDSLGSAAPVLGPPTGASPLPTGPVVPAQTPRTCSRFSSQLFLEVPSALLRKEGQISPSSLSLGAGAFGNE